MELIIPSIPWAGALLALACIMAAVRNNARKRLIQSLPTSRSDGVFIGLVELNGSAESAQPLHGYLTGTPCVHYAWTVEEQWSRTVTRTDSKGRTTTRREQGWNTIASGGESQPFYLKDTHGAVRVQPQGAKLEPQTWLTHVCGRDDPLYYEKGPAQAISSSTHRRRFTEQGFALHAPVYVIGRARERDDVVAPEIAADPDAEMFLISARTEEKVVSGYRTATIVWSLVGALLLPGMLVWWDAVEARDWHTRWPFYGAALLGYGVAWAMGWSWSVYNALIGLRNRVRHGLSLIDVQLHRRHDLIPGLLRIVEALKSHEQRVQLALGALRAESGAAPPGGPRPAPHALNRSLLALSESYPELAANTAFLALQREMTATENRIALARDYFNSIATHYNTCLQQHPDRAVAALAMMRAQPLLEAGDFERAEVEVRLAP